MTKQILCPTADFECPYYNLINGECTLEDVAEQCDDYMSMED